jgi:hypothetical protein
LLADLLSYPSVVLGGIDAAAVYQVDRLLLSANLFDAHAAHVVYVARAQGWPALSDDPDRLLRISPALEVDLVGSGLSVECVAWLHPPCPHVTTIADPAGSSGDEIDLPGWEQRSVWGYDTSISSFFAKLWTNFSISDAPEIRLSGLDTIYPWPGGIVLEIVERINEDPLAIVHGLAWPIPTPRCGRKTGSCSGSGS